MGRPLGQPCTPPTPHHGNIWQPGYWRFPMAHKVEAGAPPASQDVQIWLTVCCFPWFHLGSHQPRCSIHAQNTFMHVHTCSYKFIHFHPCSYCFPKKMEGQSIARTGSFPTKVLPPRTCRYEPRQLTALQWEKTLGLWGRFTKKHRVTGL